MPNAKKSIPKLYIKPINTSPSTTQEAKGSFTVLVVNFKMSYSVYHISPTGNLNRQDLYRYLHTITFTKAP